jgi:N-glycosidase YbiA
MIEIRSYLKNEVVSFYKTDEKYGLLSNMKGKQTLILNDILFYSSESIYQALRFPDKSDIQYSIAFEKSPIIAKRIARHYISKTRDDWEIVKNNIMRFCLRTKAMQSNDFYDLLLTTDNIPIVELSKNDEYWGAKNVNDLEYRGQNVLGRLLMELREELRNNRLDDRIKKLITIIPNLRINDRIINIDDYLVDCEKAKLIIQKGYL